jgi:hypothetical protein
MRERNGLSIADQQEFSTGLAAQDNPQFGSTFIGVLQRFREPLEQICHADRSMSASEQ